MPDQVFDDPLLAEVYDDLDSDRSDLDVYLSIALELGARSVVDVGCGTGTFACMLAERGFDVVGVDPAAAMLAVARRKVGADPVKWVHGMASDLRVKQVDLVTMTGNVAQVFLEDREWAETLEAIRGMLRPGGSFVFETRRPEREAWLDWNPRDSFERVEIDGRGVVETWNEVAAVSLPFVTFRSTIVFQSNATTLTSESTLRFRSYDEIVASLDAATFDVIEVREAPDRPGKEHVFLANRRERSALSARPRSAFTADPRRTAHPPLNAARPSATRSGG